MIPSLFLEYGTIILATVAKESVGPMEGGPIP